MSKELVVSSSPHETKLAILEDDRLVEIYIEREAQQGLAGSIHKGRVTRVLPGMQSAFVDVGLERDAFLYVSDFFEAAEELDEGLTAKADIPAPEPGEAEEERRQADGPRRGDRRQRRGRRRRRRGNRREAGFPDSKYASLDREREESDAAGKAEPVEESPASESPEPAEAQSQPSETGFTVLPGESLAKYRDQSPSEDAPFGTESGESPETRPAGDPESFSEAAAVAGMAPAEDATGVPEEAAESDDGTPPNDAEWPASRDGARAASETATISEAGLEESAEDREGDDRKGDWNAQAEALPEEAPLARAEAEKSAAPEKAAVFGEAPGDGGESPDGFESDEEAATETDEAPPEEARQAAPGAPLPKLEAVRLRGSAGPSRYSSRRRRRGRGRWGRSVEAAEEKKDEVSQGPDEPAETGEEQDGRAKITSLLKKGMEILVQISKEPLGRKGARITSHIALPGRYLVYMPTVDHVGVSRKIFSDAERNRLRTVIRTHRTGMPGGFIARTAAEGASEEEIRGDMLFLYNLWLDIRERAEKRSSTGLIHQDLDVVERILRDQLGEDFKTIWVDSEEEYERILRFVERFQPQFLSRVKLYTRPRPIFDEFNITGELEKALRPKVWLKSGGYIVINQTEALVAIDVNTGKYVGKSDRLEDTIVNTNVEAAKEIVRQMRLRDLGGIIVVDFIDMEDRPNRQSVLRAFEEELRRDNAPSKVLPFNEFGLISITRRRMRQSLERTLCSPCPYCTGAGSVKSIQTVILAILDDARKLASTMERQKDVTLRVNPEVARHLKSRDNTYLQELEEILHSHVLVRSDQSLHREHYDLN